MMTYPHFRLADLYEGQQIGLTLTTRLGFPLRVLGRSNAQVIPQRIGSWWMEPLHPGTRLPARAKRRYEALVALGVRPKATVMFHEIPSGHRRTRSAAGKAAARGLLWVEQELPVMAQRLGETVDRVMIRGSQVAHEHAPVVGRALVQGAKVVGPIVGAALVTSALAVACVGVAVASAVMADPCLVIVTQDGYWIEVDRWDE